MRSTEGFGMGLAARPAEAIVLLTEEGTHPT